MKYLTVSSPIQTATAYFKSNLKMGYYEGFTTHWVADMCHDRKELHLKKALLTLVI